jgi:hypothetical protein
MRVTRGHRYVFTVTTLRGGTATASYSVRVR